MNKNSYQKLAELVTKAPRLLGHGGLFGGVNQEHGLMVEFVKFVRGLRLRGGMSPETVNIGSFIVYLGERENVEDIARRFYDMRQDGEIVDDPHIKAKNTLFNLAETLIDLGVGEKPENVGGDYEGVLRRALSSHGDTGIGAKADGKKGPGNVQNFLKKQPQKISKGERPEASPKTPLPTMGESLTDDISIVQGEEDQAGALVISASAASRAGVPRSGTEAPSEEKAKAEKDEIAATPESVGTQESASAPERDIAFAEGGLQPGSEEISGDTLGESELLMPLTAPVTGEIAVLAAGGMVGKSAGRAENRRVGSRATGEALAGTRVAPGEQRRHIAQLPDGGRMLRKGPKKQSQKQEQREGSTAEEARQDQARQAAPGRNPAQDFANLQAAQPQKNRVGRRVAGGAAVAGSLALMKGMYGGAAASAATFGILQTIIDLLT